MMQEGDCSYRPSAHRIYLVRGGVINWRLERVGSLFPHRGFDSRASFQLGAPFPAEALVFQGHTCVSVWTVLIAVAWHGPWIGVCGVSVGYFSGSRHRTTLESRLYVR